MSWIRISDAHILTVDDEVFISDHRISPIHEQLEDEEEKAAASDGRRREEDEEGDEGGVEDVWTLQIK